MNTVRAIYENGVFRALCPVELPNHSLVEFEPRQLTPASFTAAMRGIYDVLEERFASGDNDVAARHDEHQP